MIGSAHNTLARPVRESGESGVPRCHFREFHVTDVSKRHVTIYVLKRNFSEFIMICAI